MTGSYLSQSVPAQRFIRFAHRGYLDARGRFRLAADAYRAVLFLMANRPMPLTFDRLFCTICRVSSLLTGDFFVLRHSAMRNAVFSAHKFAKATFSLAVRCHFIIHTVF